MNLFRSSHLAFHVSRRCSDRPNCYKACRFAHQRHNLKFLKSFTCVIKSMRLLIFHLLIPIVVASPESAATLEERQWPEVYTPSIPTLEYTICSAYEGLACNWPPGERRCCGDEDDGSYLYCGWWNRMRVGWCDCEFGALCVYLTNPPLWSSCQIPPHPTHCGLKKEGWVSNRELYIIEAELE